MGTEKTEGERSWFGHTDMETAWKAEQTMRLQVSYLCGGNEMGASVGGSQSPVWAPEVPAGSRGGDGPVLVTASTLLVCQSCLGVQSYREPVLRSRGQPSGSSQ